MDGFNLEKIGAAVGSVLIFLGAAFAVLRGHNRSDGKPPAQRSPTYNEMREAVSDFRRLIERHREATGEETSRVEDRVERVLRNQERMEDRIDNLHRAVERIEASQHFEQVARAWRREAREEK